ncbi:MAG TPA: alpha/beta hydrolase [Jatrophihabitans sp.]|jgi:pimeloyl-ACP methyl ester carboxylesterase|nr:alpha/beta hydrolase [Jatrophihabitans sp.]
MALTADESAQVEAANASGKRPAVFIHGLWLLPSSWDRWRRLFEGEGYVTLAPGWPDDPSTVEEARARPEVFAGKSIGALTDHHAAVVRKLDTKPVLVGHSFGGLITQQLAGRGLAAASVAVDPAPFRGVLPVPLAALRATLPVLRRPSNRRRAVMLSERQYRFAFANAVSSAEARALYATYPVPGAGLPVFQAAFANINPRSETRVDRRNPGRGPLMLIGGERDNTVPWAMLNAAYKKQRRNAAVTELIQVPGRGHSLVFDNGWEQIAQLALEFFGKHLPS